jgi:hypothetical protein
LDEVEEFKLYDIEVRHYYELAIYIDDLALGFLQNDVNLHVVCCNIAPAVNLFIKNVESIILFFLHVYTQPCDQFKNLRTNGKFSLM